MRMLLFDLAVNAALLLADAALLVLLWKKRDLKWLATAMAAYGVAVFFGLVLTVAVTGIFGAMRALAWAIFVHGALLLAGSSALFWRTRRRLAIVGAVKALVIAVIGVDAFFIEPYQLEVSRVRLTSSKLTRPLRIAVVADLQTDVIGAHERRALELVKAEKPDLVLFAGDYIQEYDRGRRAGLQKELRALLKELGFNTAIAVEGNCDSEMWPEIFEGTGVRVALSTRTIEERGVQVTALGLEDSFNTNLAVARVHAFHIAVGHAPDFAMGDVQADLLVAGHTHGGQVRLPLLGPLITLSAVPKSWAAGVTKLSGDRTLVVSRGIGLERGPAPRLRFLCRPEVVIVDVVPAN